jgi:hypothetical protein
MTSWCSFGEPQVLLEKVLSEVTSEVAPNGVDVVDVVLRVVD